TSGDHRAGVDRFGSRVGLCLLGFVAAGVVSGLDVYGVRAMGLTEEELQQESRRVKLQDLGQFSLQFWLLVLSIMFYYNGVFPFVADASQFINQKYSLDDKVSAYITGAVYDVSMLLSPFLGASFEATWPCCARLLTIPVFGLLAFTTVYPLVSTLWLGVTYSFAAASMWPSLPLVVPRATLGTALGFSTSVQMIGIGVSNVVVGRILGQTDRYTALCLASILKQYPLCDAGPLEAGDAVPAGNVIAAVVVTLLLNAVDLKRRSLAWRRMDQLVEDGIAHASIESGSADASSAAGYGVDFAPRSEADERSPLLSSGGSSSGGGITGVLPATSPPFYSIRPRAPNQNETSGPACITLCLPVFIRLSDRPIPTDRGAGAGLQRAGFQKNVQNSALAIFWRRDSHAGSKPRGPINNAGPRLAMALRFPHFVAFAFAFLAR
uniref:MFS domain-containing protein n=1 Tax=Macrostomum lignano TaxID=282301 RepID=A0A1I8JNB9_9PLAT